MAEFYHAQSFETGGSIPATGSGKPVSQDEMSFIGTGLGDYFQAISRLKDLREEIARSIGLPACDLIRLLDAEALQAGFEPVGANRRGDTSDKFFKQNLRFRELEERLAHRIVPENVCEVLALIQEADYYKPTRYIVTALESAIHRLLA